MVDVLKCHLLGEVEYAQHNFARLRPLLYSLDGRKWAGATERSWFPETGLVFSLAPDLRFAASGTLWTFQIKPNERLVGGEGKDVFMTIQVKPAVRFMTELEPMTPEWLRIQATVTGFDPRSPIGGVLLPETDDRWVLVPEFERGADDLARVTNERLLPHMRVLEGTPEAIAEMATPDGRWALPVINSGYGTEIRNWTQPAALAEQIASNLRRWLPHAPHREKAAAAAQALRELAPHLAGISALRSNEVKAALARLTDLVENADALTGSLDELVKGLLSAPAIERQMEAEKAKMRRELEAQVLESAERLEAEARERLLREQAEVAEQLERDRKAHDAIQLEITTAESELEAVRKRQRSETAQFTKSLEGLIARARTEPAAYAAEWLGRLGLGATSGNLSANSSDVQLAECSEATREPVTEVDLGRVLSRISPIRNEGLPKFLLMDSAIRARELVVGVGPGAREVIECWLSEMVALTAIVGAADPTILSFAELLPTGPRGPGAPLARAINLASRYGDRPVVALLDDIDVTAGTFWLPLTARAARQPRAHGLPSNLFLIGLTEGDPAGLNLTPARAGELFPMTFDNTVPSESAAIESARRELELALFEGPTATNRNGSRVESLRRAASKIFNDDDVESIRAGFDEYLEWAKLGRPTRTADTAVGNDLVTAATLMISKGND